MNTERVDAEQDWRSWRARREAELVRPHGWLSLTALHWLDGAATALPGLPGRWWHQGNTLWVAPEAADSLPITVDGQVLAGPVAVLEGDGDPRTVRTGERLIEPLHRGRAWGVRVRDPQAPTRIAFAGVPTFPFDAAWMLPARFEAFESGPRRTSVASVADGIEHVIELAGIVSFEVAGQPVFLTVGTGLRPIVAFRDGTSGAETYSALRFVPVAIAGTEAVVDFNRATNPPCAFTDFGTCPLPPPGNSLRVPITAGERTPHRHVVPG